ncbi:MAG TPA: YfiR family protein [Desulfobulbus sp.]|nr:YfiR family protein [Desulfobulbus sp.]
MRQPISFIIVLSLLLVMWAGAFRASIAAGQQTDTQVEYKIKAAFLLNFAKFITWPKQTFATKDQAFTLCVLGRDPFGPALSAIQSRTVGKRKIELRYIDTVRQAETCQMVYISGSEKEGLETINAALRNRAIVTVSDMQGFARTGGIIEFVIRGSKLSFIINLAAANKQGVHINSSLLNLAVEVIR